MKLVVK